MARNPRSVRLVLALSVAGVLAVFLLYVSLAGGRTAQVNPSELSRHTGNVSLVGKVVGTVHGAGYSNNGLHFAVSDIGAKQAESVPVVYRGSVPDLFRTGREVRLEGRLQNGVFVAKPDSLRTKCRHGCGARHTLRRSLLPRRDAANCSPLFALPARKPVRNSRVTLSINSRTVSLPPGSYQL